MFNISDKVVRLFDKISGNPEAAAKEAEYKYAIKALKRLCDRALMDIGIPRDNIEQTVRYGRAANDSNYDEDSAA